MKIVGIVIATILCLLTLGVIIYLIVDLIRNIIAIKTIGKTYKGKPTTKPKKEKDIDFE